MQGCHSHLCVLLLIHTVHLMNSLCLTRTALGTWSEERGEYTLGKEAGEHYGSFLLKCCVLFGQVLNLSVPPFHPL